MTERMVGFSGHVEGFGEEGWGGVLVENGEGDGGES